MVSAQDVETKLEEIVGEQPWIIGRRAWEDKNYIKNAAVELANQLGSAEGQLEKARENGIAWRKYTDKLTAKLQEAEKIQADINAEKARYASLDEQLKSSDKAIDARRERRDTLKELREEYKNHLREIREEYQKLCEDFRAVETSNSDRVRISEQLAGLEEGLTGLEADLNATNLELMDATRELYQAMRGKVKLSGMKGNKTPQFEAFYRTVDTLLSAPPTESEEARMKKISKRAEELYKNMSAAKPYGNENKDARQNTGKA